MIKLQDNIYFDYEVLSTKNNKEMVFQGYLIYNKNKIIPLQPVTAISLLNDNNGYYDYDNNYLYVVFNDEIIEVFDLLKKEFITNKNKQKYLFYNYQQTKFLQKKQLTKRKVMFKK